MHRRALQVLRASVEGRVACRAPRAQALLGTASLNALQRAILCSHAIKGWSGGVMGTSPAAMRRCVESDLLVDLHAFHGL